MKYTKLNLSNAYLVEVEKLTDSRGFFGRTWCSKEFTEQGLSKNMVQSSISFNLKAGTLRGMHYAVLPATEAKLVRCTMGSIFDVIIDLRPNSPTFLQHTSILLSATNYKSIFIPSGFAHGFLTLENNTEVHYMMDDYYRPDCSHGFRWNDPTFNIQWPEAIKVINERDKNYPDFSQEHIS